MNRCLTTGLALSLLAIAIPAPAAQKSVTVQALTRFVDGRREWRESRPYAYVFEVEVISERDGPKREGWRQGRPFIAARPGEEYRVRIHNPLPVAVAANLSIDGLNSITGAPGSPSGGSKWVIEPFSFVDVAGWQVSGRESRRFYFTSREGSYAAWRSNDWGRDLAVNCGVIGVAYFWSQRALDDHFDANPVVIARPDIAPGGRDRSGGWDALSAQDKAAPQAAAEQRAGTGMGRRRSNPVREVDFRYDRGMYEVRDAVIIAYDFDEAPTPQPFEGGYAPEAPDDGNRGSRPWHRVEPPRRR